MYADPGYRGVHFETTRAYIDWNAFGAPSYFKALSDIDSSVVNYWGSRSATVFRDDGYGTARVCVAQGASNYWYSATDDQGSSHKNVTGTNRC